MRTEVGAALIVRLARRTYAALHRLTPRDFRERHGREPIALFEELARAAHRDRGAAGVVVIWLHAVLDLARRSPRERSRRPPGIPAQETAMLDALLTDLRHAARGLRTSIGFSLLVVLTLGAAIGANAAVFSVVDGVLLRRLPYADSDRLVMVFNRYPTLERSRAAQNPQDFMNLRELSGSFDAVEAVGSLFPKTLTGMGDPERIDTLGVSRGLLPLLGAELALGRHLDSDDDHTAVLVSHGFWQERYAGSDDVLGATLTLNAEPHVIVGVLAPGFELHLPGHLSFPTDVPIWNRWPEGWMGGANGAFDTTAHWIKTVARLAPDVSRQQAQAELDALAIRQRDQQPRRAEREAEIVAVPLHAELVGRVRPTLMALLGAVGLLLLIACANVANLMLARGNARQAELAVRAACGGNRWRIVRLLALEGVTLAALATTAGAGIAWAGVQIMIAVSPDDLPLRDTIAIDVRVLAFAVAIASATTILVGLLPALAATRERRRSPIPDDNRAGDDLGRAGFRSLLVVAEIALSLVLLVGGGLLLRSFLLLASESPGFETHNVLTFTAAEPRDVITDGQTGAGWHNHPGRHRYYRRLQTAFAEIPGVEAVATVFPTPLGGSTSGSTYAPEERPDLMEDSIAASLLVTPGYFDTMRIRLVAGRDFDWDDQGDKLVISESMAVRLWPGESALGKRITVGWWSGPETGEVVGIVANTRSIDLSVDDPETVYRPAAAYAYSPQTFVVRSSSDPRALVGSLRSVLAGTDPTVPLADLAAMDVLVGRQLVATRFATTLIGAFAGIGLLISTVGLYGVIAYITARRTHEIGIRMALGADRPAIFRMVLRQGGLLAAGGIVTGAAAAWALAGTLESLLYGVTPNDAPTFAALAALLAAVALVACWRPARRAARVDPIRSLQGP